MNDDDKEECSNIGCSICLVDFGGEEIKDKKAKAIHMTPCKHYFHKECLQYWLKNNYLCPNCRREVRPF